MKLLQRTFLSIGRKMAILGMICLPGHYSPTLSSNTSPPVIVPSIALQHSAVHRDRRANFAVTATGTAPLTYQWRRDGLDLQGETNRTLSLAAAQPGDEGDFSVEVRNPGGSAVSPAVHLFVVPPTAEFKFGTFTNQAGARLPYYLFVPPGYDPSRKYPVACFYHGLGGDEDNLPGFFESWACMFVFASYKQQAIDPAFVLWPTHKASEDFGSRHRVLVLELLDYLIATYSIDTNRIYTGGASAGEDDAWETLGMRPDFFAGALFWDGWVGSTRPADIKHVPIWAWGTFGTHSSMVGLRTAGGRPISTEYSNADHLGAIRTAQSTPAAVNWLLAQRRGQAVVSPFALTISGPNGPVPSATGATTLDYSGTVAAIEGRITEVSWENRANRAKGKAEGTQYWSIAGLPLVPNETNLIVVTATCDTTWTPGYRGTTKFNGATSVYSIPIRASLSLYGTEPKLDWQGGVPPFTVQGASALSAGAWVDLIPDAVPPVTLTAPNLLQFYRIKGH